MACGTNECLFETISELLEVGNDQYLTHNISSSLLVLDAQNNQEN